MAKLIGICKLKNEADFIEHFARLNSAVLDELYCVDDQSSDNTREILDGLCAEGLVTQYYRLNDTNARAMNQQGEVLTRLMRRIACQEYQRSDCFVFPLDADEIIIGKRDDIVRQLDNMPGEYYGLITWKTFVPINGGMGKGDNICHSFLPLAWEQTDLYKAVVPIKYARTTAINLGNHTVSCHGRKLKPVKLDICLAHFPVRSANQIISKALVTAHKMTLNNRIKKGEGGHIVALADRMRSLDFKLTGQLLTEMAASYCYPDGDMPELDAAFNMREAFPEIKLKYDIKEVDPVAALDDLLTDVIDLKRIRYSMGQRERLPWIRSWLRRWRRRCKR